MQPIVVTVGPIAAGSANAICTSQRHAGAKGFALNGSLSSGFSATNIATAQAVAGAGNLTLDGSLVSGGVATLRSVAGAYVTITSAGNDSGITFTVKGIAYGTSGQYAVSETLTGSNTSVVSTTKLFYQVTSIAASGAAAGNVSAGTNGVITLDKPRQVLITSAGNDSGITFTFTGTDWNNNPITETVTGPNATTATTVEDFSTITSIVTSGTTASTVTIGTNGVAHSRPVFIDAWAFPQTALQVVVSGTVNYTIEQTLDNPNDSGMVNVSWFNHPDPAFVAATASAQSNYAYPPRMTRAKLNSGTGTITYTIIQAAMVPA